MSMENGPKSDFENIMLAVTAMLGEIAVPFVPASFAKYVYGKDWRGPTMPYMIGLDLLRASILFAGVVTKNDWLISTYFVSGLAETAALNFTWTSVDK